VGRGVRSDVPGTEKYIDFMADQQEMSKRATHSKALRRLNHTNYETN